MSVSWCFAGMTALRACAGQGSFLDKNTRTTLFVAQQAEKSKPEEGNANGTFRQFEHASCNKHKGSLAS